MLGMSFESVKDDLLEAAREWREKCPECQRLGRLCFEHFDDYVKRLPGVKTKVIDGEECYTGISLKDLGEARDRLMGKKKTGRQRR